jgi:hypothetical protein
MTMKRDDRRNLFSLIMPIQRKRREKYRYENYKRKGYNFLVIGNREYLLTYSMEQRHS